MITCDAGYQYDWRTFEWVITFRADYQLCGRGMPRPHGQGCGGGGQNMRYDLNKHHRRSIRLKGFDYTREAAYFLTISTQNQACLFGGIVERTKDLSANGVDNYQGPFSTQVEIVLQRCA